MAFVWFWTAWVGYRIYADHGPAKARSVSAIMRGYRKDWMATMVRRENRIVDSGILGNLLNGVAFFASATIFAIGGLCAAMGASEEALRILQGFSWTKETSAAAWELKLLLLLVIMVYAFFKFAWSFRLYNYTAVLIGATPLNREDMAGTPIVAARAAGVANLAASHFNQGLRAYFFALAALAWLINPGLFMAATTWVVYVIYRREFHSRSLKIVQGVKDEVL